MDMTIPTKLIKQKLEGFGLIAIASDEMTIDRIAYVLYKTSENLECTFCLTKISLLIKISLPFIQKFQSAIW